MPKLPNNPKKNEKKVEQVMDEIKIKYLINMSEKYLNNTLESKEKENIVNASRSLFYETLYESLADSELNKRLQFFAVMAQHFGQNKPMNRQKAKDLKEMIKYIRV